MAKDGSARTKWLVGTIIGLLGAGGGIVALLEYADRPSARMSELEINTDRYGADYSDFPSSDVDACASACLADEHWTSWWPHFAASSPRATSAM